ncbi:MAG: HEAT repeat domain-containing protein [Thermoproteota archaeon]
MDENDVRLLPPAERLEKCISILKNEKDESMRWDAVWLAGEITETLEPNDPMVNQIADLFVWVLENDDNGVVKHEAAFQIAARNMRHKIKDLVHAGLHNKSELTRHESIEALGLMRAFESEPAIMEAMKDPDHNVRETALFVLKRLQRLKNSKHKFVPKI